MNKNNEKKILRVGLLYRWNSQPVFDEKEFPFNNDQTLEMWKVNVGSIEFGKTFHLFIFVENTADIIEAQSLLLQFVKKEINEMSLLISKNICQIMQELGNIKSGVSVSIKK